MALASMSEIFERMARNGQEFWEVVLADDMDERQVSREASMAKMLTTWQAMQDAADSYTGRKRSVSGLVGGDGMKMRQYTFRGCAMTGGYVSEVIGHAVLPPLQLLPALHGGHRHQRHLRAGGLSESLRLGRLGEAALCGHGQEGRGLRRLRRVRKALPVSASDSADARAMQG